MAEPLRHRQTKGAETDMPSLPPPRHIPTLPSSDFQFWVPLTEADNPALDTLVHLMACSENVRGTLLAGPCSSAFRLTPDGIPTEMQSSSESAWATMRAWYEFPDGCSKYCFPNLRRPNAALKPTTSIGRGSNSSQSGRFVAASRPTTAMSRSQGAI